MADANSRITFDEYILEAGNLDVDCREAGSGLPIIFLETICWGHRYLYEALARQYHLFILSFEDAKEDGAEAAVRELAKSLAGDTYTLIGSSQGANLALRTVLRTPMEPEPAETLILIGPNAIRPDPDLRDLDWVGWSRRLLAHIERQSNLSALPGGWELEGLFLPKDSDAELESWLREISCPTLVAFGTRDRMISPDTPSTYRAAIPNCHVSLVYDAGHLVAAERPEAVTSAVIDFVENRETFVVTRHGSVINP